MGMAAKVMGGASRNALVVAGAGDISEPEKPIEEQLEGIVGRLQQLADRQVVLKRPVELRWIENLRRYHGRYEPTIEAELIDQKKSRAFVRVTRKKTNSWSGRLDSLIFPTDDRNWGIQPTPVPSLAAAAQDVANKALALVAQANAQSAQAGAAADQGDAQGAETAMQQAGATADQAHSANEQANQIAEEIRAAKKCSDAMQREMDDQLTECRYTAEGRTAIHDLCQLGTAIMKGPLVSEAMRGSWAPQEGTPGQFIYSKTPDPRPVFKRVNPWAYFPDMSAQQPDEREFDFERHLWTKTDLRKLVKQRGFSKDAVRRILERNTREQYLTDAGLGYLAELRDLDGTTEPLRGRYVGWEYHGPLECDEIVTMLRALGQEDQAAEYERTSDPLVEMRVICYFCEGELLKIAPEYPLDSQESLYSVVPFEASESSIFGYGVPDVMASSQDSLNAGWRMALDNAGLSTGPQILVDRSKVSPANGRWEITPRKIWYKTTTLQQGEAFEAISISNNVTSILNIVEASRKFIDDETQLPVQSEGEAVENPNVTATASNIMSLGQNVTFRSVVKSWDDEMTVPNMRRLYDWNMQFNKRSDIKGDMSIDARGTSVLLMRELQSQVLAAIVTNHLENPTIAPMLKPYAAYRQFLSSAMISPDDLMVTEDEYKAEMKAQADNQQQDPAIMAAQIKAASQEKSDKVRYQIAELSEQTAMIGFATQKDMTLVELNTELQKLKVQTDSKERMFAAELGADQAAAEKDRAAGLVPAGSGGSFSFGATEPGHEEGAARAAAPAQ
jgi:hypothetical protein